MGTISPIPSLDEAYGYFDSNLFISGTLNFDGKGTVALSGSQIPLLAYLAGVWNLYNLTSTPPSTFSITIIHFTKKNSSLNLPSYQ